jgi:tRNA dimethylallyltransferase
MSLEEAIELVKMRSRNYAKRQLTWFRNHDIARELNKDQLTEEEILKIMEECIK